MVFRSTLIISILLFSFTNASAQTIADTRVWLKSTIQNYLDRSMYDKQIWMDFNENEIWFSQFGGEGLIVNQITIKDINQVIVKQTNKGYTLYLGCDSNERCCEVVNYGVSEHGTAVKKPGDKINYPAYEVYLTSGLSENNLNNRLSKALFHLIKLSGGKVISETF